MPSSKTASAFLAAYREYENSIKSAQKGSPKDYEDELRASGADLQADKLSVCRAMRNFVVHSSEPLFIEVSQAQVDFLKKTSALLAAESGMLVLSSMKSFRTASVSETDRCAAAVEICGKLKVDKVVVLKKNGGYGLASVYDTARSLLKTKTSLISSIKLLPVEFFVGKETPAESVPKGAVCIVTDDGSKTGRPIGVFYN